MIIATFSNGFTDTYKGHRPVKAAWAIIEKATGKVLNSGHSLDRAKAQKTAEGNIEHTVRTGKSTYSIARQTYGSVAYHQYMSKIARELGWNGKGRYENTIKAYNETVRAEKRALVTIEVVDL